MSEEYSFPPYNDEMMKVIDKFGAKKIEKYRGEDVTPLWDLKGGPLLRSFKYLYAAPKLEKIAITVQSFRDKLMTYIPRLSGLMMSMLCPFIHLSGLKVPRAVIL
jgi:hypothetical protein